MSDAATQTGPSATLRNWRLVTAGAIALLAAVGWAYLLAAVAAGHDVAGLGPGMALLAPVAGALGAIIPPGLLNHGPVGYSAVDLAAVLAMWVAMVLAMMLPTAAPMLLAYAAAGRRSLSVGAGYVAVWIAAAVAATALQAGAVHIGALSPHMAPAGVALSASVLIAAGVYQFTPLKSACLIRCRTPHAFVGAERGGAAFRLGIEEGLACLGCCWAMMAVMVAAGVMNLVAMAFLGALMALEKIATGLLLTRIVGVCLLVAGFGLASSLFFG